MEKGFDRSSFARTLRRLMLPIAVQNLLSAVVSTADVMMLSGVSQDALSASSLAGQITFVLTLFYFGLSTGASVMAAQYWGSKNEGMIEKVQGLALRLSCAVSLLFALCALLIPGLLMRAFTDDALLIGMGAKYLRWVSLSYLMMGVSQMLLAVMKSVEQTKASAQISTTCLLCNILLNALSIYVLFPGEAGRALCGVAAATSLSRVVEVLLCVIAIRKGHGIRVKRNSLISTERWLKRGYWQCTLPVLANYLIWGCATAGIAAIMGHIGSAAVAANSLAGTLRNLVIVGCSGLGSAGSIMIGILLGRDDLENAKWVGKRIATYSLVLGAASGALLPLLYRPCLEIAELDQTAADFFRGMLLINAVYCIGKSFNSCLVGGVFCAGGDTTFGLICDTAVMWGVILPAGFIAAFVLKLPALAVYGILCMDEFVKMPFVARRFKKYRWLKNLTKQNEKTNGE